MPEPTMPAIGGSRTLAQAEEIAGRVAAGETLAQAVQPPASPPEPAQAVRPPSPPPEPAPQRRRPAAGPKE